MSQDLETADAREGSREPARPEAPELSHIGPPPRYDSPPGSSLLERPYLTHSRLLGERLLLHQRVRAWASLVMAAGALFAHFVLGLHELPMGGLLLLAVVIFAYDAAFWILTRPYRDGGRPARGHLEHLMFHAGWIDFVALTATVWMVGGARSPFMPFFLLHLVLSSLMLSRGATLALGAIAYGLILGLIGVDLTGVLPSYALPGDLAAPGSLTWRAALTLAVVYGLAILVSLYLFIGLSRNLRRGEEAVRVRARELHHLASQRRDFLRVTTHNMRSPVGAAVMFLRNLDAGLGGPLNERQAEWVRRALKRLNGLGTFLTEMTQFAALEAGQLEKRVEAVRLDRVLASIVEEYADAADERAQVLELEVEPDLPSVSGMPRLLREAVVNYVTNALKYTPEGGRIRVSGRRSGDAVLLEVTDGGLGIPPDRLDAVFEDFGRVESELPDGTKPEGTGLGLSITKRIVEAHGGLVGVESVVGLGSRFRIVLPLTPRA